MDRCSRGAPSLSPPRRRCCCPAQSRRGRRGRLTRGPVARPRRPHSTCRSLARAQTSAPKLLLHFYVRLSHKLCQNEDCFVHNGSFTMCSDSECVGCHHRRRASSLTSTCTYDCDALPLRNLPVYLCRYLYVLMGSVGLCVGDRHLSIDSV